MNKKTLICDLIAKILEFAFLIVMAVNLKDISRHLCCEMENAVITTIILFSLLNICILSQIINTIICLIKHEKEKKHEI